LIQETARPLGVKPRVPATNLDGAARNFKTHYRAFSLGVWLWRLIKQGPVRAHNCVPPYAEIRKYIAAILKM
tara:strand:- start:384 stop:599 length:216 start_codon:yes stop_codon:yes gene_type:complete